MLRVDNLEFSYGEQPLYSGVSFIVGKGQKIGLAGPNGAGKSTLLKMLTGREDGYKGKVTTLGTIGLVPQEVKYDPDMAKAETAREYVNPTNSYPDYEIIKLFSSLELKVSLDSNPSKFSGGQKTKLALARALLMEPDILLLDEPTNFMDIAGKKWVMDFLSDYEGTVIVISHDLDLMDRAIDKVLFVNPATKAVEEYKGNYSQFLKLKKEKEEQFRKEVLIKQQKVKQLEKGLEKMKHMNKFSRAKIRQTKRLEKARENLPQMPRELGKIKVNLPDPANVGEIPIRAIHLTKAYGDVQVLKDVNFFVTRGESVAFIGPNGVGKSTTIKILMDKLQPDSGEVVKNPLLKVGYYSQEFETFDFEKTMLDTFIDETNRDSDFARNFLGRFMFGDDRVFQKVGSLSGGEKTRLSIAMLTGRDNNLLILDEPTTYLDVLSQRIILESLKEYKGTMIIVSHTPEFVKELKPNKALLFPEEKLIFWDDELLDRVDEI